MEAEEALSFLGAWIAVLVAREPFVHARKSQRQHSSRRSAHSGGDGSGEQELVRYFFDYRNFVAACCSLGLSIMSERVAVAHGFTNATHAEITAWTTANPGHSGRLPNSLLLGCLNGLVRMHSFDASSGRWEVSRFRFPEIVGHALPSHLEEDEQRVTSARLLELCEQTSEPDYVHDKDAIRQLLEAGADVNAGSWWMPLQSRADALTSLVMSYSADAVEVAELLLQHGADPQGGDTQERSIPLLYTARGSPLGRQMVPMVKLLLRYGALVGKNCEIAQRFEFRSAVEAAQEAIQMIRAHNPYARPNAEGGGGDEEYAAELAVRSEVLDLLLAAQAMQRRFERWRRVAPLVGRWRLFLTRWFEEVHFRPEHAGAKRCRDEFEQLQKDSSNVA